MAWTLEGSCVAVRVREGEEQALGRGDLVQDDPRLSRTQVRLAMHDGHLSVTRLGKNPSVLRRDADGSELVLELDVCTALAHRDELFLLPELHRFLVHAPKRSRSRSHAASNDDVEVTYLGTHSPFRQVAKKARSQALINLEAALPHVPPEALKGALDACGGSSELAADLLLTQDFSSPHGKLPAPTPPPSRPVPAAAAPKKEMLAMGALPSGRRVYRLNAVKGSAEAGTVSLDRIIVKGLEAARWLLQTVPVLQTVPLLLVHGQEPAPEVPPGVRNVTLIRPRMPMQYGVCHGKCFVLFYAMHLRFVVSTANLLDCDYERKTQGLYYEDFARKAPNEQACAYEDTLVDYLRRTGVPPAWLMRVRQHSFATSQAILLSSVPGRHEGEALNRYGHMQLRQHLRGQLSKGALSPLVCQASSMGSVYEAWLAEICTSFAGTDTPVPKARVAEHIRIVWPTVDFVRHCIDGYLAGASLCMRAKNIKPFLRPIMIRYEPPQPGRAIIPPHIKSYYRPDANGVTPFVVLTSANLSMSAWGRLQLGGKQLQINNYELGVLFLPSRLAQAGEPAPVLRLAAESDDACADKSLMYPVPTRVVPLARYTSKDVPWSQDEPHLQPDRHGFIDTAEPLGEND